MLKGISNFQIEDVEDLLKNFVGVFPSDKITRFIDYKQLIDQKTGEYQFLISNTEVSTKDGEHWWSILDNSQKKTFFHSFGMKGLKNFMIKVQKILSATEKMTQTDDKITLVNINSCKFSMKACKKLSNKEIENLSDTTRDFFLVFKVLAIF